MLRIKDVIRVFYNVMDNQSNTSIYIMFIYYVFTDITPMRIYR